MRIIDMSKPVPTHLTCVLYGDSRSGKTEFAATWPRPLFLADAAEGGWATIHGMPRDKFYEPNRIPEVRAIETMQDMVGQIRELGDRLKKKPGDIQTLVVDSLTFYADLVQDTLRTQMADEIAKNKWLLFDKLKNHISHMVIETHKLPVHVIWICLSTVDMDGRGGILLPGQMAKKLPALCNFFFYQNVHQPDPNKDPLYEVHTRRCGNFPAGTRFGDLLPDPLPEPTFRSLAECLEIDIPQKQQSPRRAVVR